MELSEVSEEAVKTADAVRFDLALRIQPPELRGPEDDPKPFIQYLHDSNGSIRSVSRPCTTPVYKAVKGKGQRGANFPGPYDMLLNGSSKKHEFLLGFDGAGEDATCVQVHVICNMPRLPYRTRIAGEAAPEDQTVDITYMQATNSLYVKNTPRGTPPVVIRNLVKAILKKGSLKPGEEINGWSVLSVAGVLIQLQKMETGPTGGMPYGTS